VKPNIARNAATVQYMIDTGPFPRTGETSIKIGH